METPRNRLESLRLLADSPRARIVYEMPGEGIGGEPGYGISAVSGTLPLGATWYAIRQPSGIITAQEI